MELSELVGREANLLADKVFDPCSHHYDADCVCVCMCGLSYSLECISDLFHYDIVQKEPNRLDPYSLH